MVWLSSLLGIFQLVVFVLLARELFGIGYQTVNQTSGDDDMLGERQDSSKETPEGRGAREGREEANEFESRRVGGTSERHPVGPETDTSGGQENNDGIPAEGTMDDIASDEESLRLTFEDMEAVGDNLVKVVSALSDAVENEAFGRVRALAGQGADLISDDTSRSESVQALLDQRSDLVEDAVNALEEVKKDLETNLVKHADEATVEPMANMHESRADGLFHSDIEALKEIPNDFFKDKISDYEEASTDEDRVRIWKEAYQAMARLPQFYKPDWTDPGRVEEVVGQTVQVDGRERDRLLHELQRMHERYETVLEELPANISADESHKAAERELNLVHEALKIVERHQRLLGEVGENYDAGDVTVGQDEEQNDVSLRSVVELLGEQLRNIYEDAAQAESKNDIDVSRLKELLQVFVQSVNQVHEAIELYTSTDSKDDTISELKRIARALREERENQRRRQ